MTSRLPGEEKPPIIQISSASVPISPRTNDEKVASLIKQTGIEKEIAREFLESNAWNLNEGILYIYNMAYTIWLYKPNFCIIIQPFYFTSPSSIV